MKLLRKAAFATGRDLVLGTLMERLAGIHGDSRLVTQPGRPVLELTYEEIAADLPLALERTLAHLGIRRPRAWPPALPPMRRQSDQLSDHWAEAYARDLAVEPSRT
jgi:hypothetical protein